MPARHFRTSPIGVFGHVSWVAGSPPCLASSCLGGVSLVARLRSDLGSFDLQAPGTSTLVVTFRAVGRACQQLSAVLCNNIFSLLFPGQCLCLWCPCLGSQQLTGSETAWGCRPGACSPVLEQAVGAVAVCLLAVRVLWRAVLQQGGRAVESTSILRAFWRGGAGSEPALTVLLGSARQLRRHSAVRHFRKYFSPEHEAFLGAHNPFHTAQGKCFVIIISVVSQRYQR